MTYRLICVKGELVGLGAIAYYFDKYEEICSDRVHIEGELGEVRIRGLWFWQDRVGLKPRGEGVDVILCKTTPPSKSGKKRIWKTGPKLKKII